MIPPGDFEVAGIRILAPQMNNTCKELYTESRRAVGEGQSYNVQIKNHLEKTLQLNCSGFENFRGEEIWLVNNRVNHHADLKRTPVVEIPAGTETYTLVIGSREYVAKQTGQVYSKENELFKCYPNPFKNQATIGFSITSDCNVTLVVYDIRGKLVRELASQAMQAGYHETVFDAADVTPGIYFCKMSATTVSGQVVFSKVIRLEVMK